MKIQIQIKNKRIIEEGKLKKSSVESLMAATEYLIKQGVLKEDGVFPNIWNLYDTKTNKFKYQLFFYPLY